jgi:hypothetical protein
LTTPNCKIKFDMLTAKCDIVRNLFSIIVEINSLSDHMFFIYLFIYLFNYLWFILQRCQNLRSYGVDIWCIISQP